MMGAVWERLGERPTTKLGEMTAVCRVGKVAQKIWMSLAAWVVVVGKRSMSAMSSQTWPGVEPSGASQMRAAPEVWMKNLGDEGREEEERPVSRAAFPAA